MNSKVINEVLVDVANPLQGEHSDVQNAIAGFAYLSAALLSVGYDGMVTEELGSGYETLVPKLMEGLENASVVKKLEEAHPTIGSLIVELEKNQTSEQYDRFIYGFGALDVLYRLVRTDDEAQQYTFSIDRIC